MFYSFGYRYNFEKSRIEKTGVFFIKSYPKNASIYLNDKLQKRKTPTQINRLLANNYNLRVEKEGYYSWSKNLPIYPQTTTFAEDITLFKKGLKPNLMIEGNFSEIKPALNLQKMILVENLNPGSNLIYHNLLSNKNTSLTSSKNLLKTSSWCNSNNKIIVKDGNDYLIINVESGNVDSLLNLTKNYFINVQCDFYNDNVFYALQNKKLYEIDLVQRKITKLTDDIVLSFTSWKSKIIYIALVDNKYILKSLSGENSTELLVMPTSLDYTFIQSNQNYLAILDKDEKIVYIIDPEANQPYKTIIKQVNDLAWYDKQFIYWNEFELWAYYPESQESIFIERASTPIQNAFWHSAFTYVFGQINNILKVYELDGRDSRNVHEILTLTDDTKDNIFVNKKGDKLYWLSTINDQMGLFEVEIQ